MAAFLEVMMIPPIQVKPFLPIPIKADPTGLSCFPYTGLSILDLICVKDFCFPKGQTVLVIPEPTLTPKTLDVMQPTKVSVGSPYWT